MRPAPSARPLVPLLAVLCLAGALAGCRPGTALHSRYNNFRAYYNTYYNAERALEEGESALERQAVTVDRNRLVAVFPETAAAQTGGPFQEAIDKSAELLRNRPNSAWADDALLLIGKAYFYQQNLVGAEQKFREAMAAAAVVEDRRLGDESRFWLGRTYAAGDRFDEGVAVLEEGLLDDEGDRLWTGRMRLALGELYARAARWDEAAETLRLGAPEEGDADVAARAYVLLAQVEEHAERWDAAAEAYREALDRKPAYELSYAAQVGRALVLGLEAGRTDEGIELIRRMRGDDKNYERRGELALLEGRLRTVAGDEARALRLYRDVLYDETLSGSSVRGEAHYRLGEFYRDVRDDYVRASAHFDTAATALRAPSADVRPSRGALLGVTAQAQTYNALAGAARRLAEADSLLALGALSEEAFEARIAEIEADRREAYREEQRRLAEARTSQAFGGGIATPITDPGGATVATPGQPATAGSSSQGGFLNYRLPSSLQAGLVAFEQTWGDRPLVPNWRRASSIQAGDVAAAQGVVGTEVAGGFGIGEGPPPLDLTVVPRTPEKRAELTVELAGLRYELANAFFLSLGRADTASALYRSILSDTPDLPVATRARYALAEIERDAGRMDAARPLYEAVAAADSAALGRASRVRLGLEEDTAVIPPPPPESAAFDAAREVWRDGRPLEAAAAFVALGDADPDAEVAPRAYLAVAAAYADWAGADSVALSRPLPPRAVSAVLLAVADSLAEAEIEVAVARALAEGSSPTVAPPPPAAPPAAVDPDDVEDQFQTDGNDLPSGLDDDGPPALPGGEPPTDPEAADGLVLPGGKEIPGRPAPQTTGVPAQVVPTPPAPAAPQTLTPARPGSVAGLVDRAPARPTPATPAARPPAGPSTPLARADTASFTLRHHLRALATRYTGTPLAARAAALIETLPAAPELDLTPYLPAPDSSAVPVLPDSLQALPDSLRPPPVAVADSALVAPADSTADPADTPLALDGPVDRREDEAADPADGPADPVAVAGDPAVPADGPALPGDDPVDPEPEVPEDDPADVPGLRGPESIDPALGGFTWRVQTITLPAEGEQTVQILREAGFRAGIIREAATLDYVVAIGQFETRELAESAEAGVPAWARFRGSIVDLVAFQEEADGDGP